MLKDKSQIAAEEIVEEVLKMDPGFELPEGFADKLTLKFEKQFAWNMYFKEFLIYFGTGIGIFLTSVAMVFFLMSDLWGNLIGLFSANLITVIGTLIILTFVLFADKVLLRYFSHKLNIKTA